MLTWLRIIVSCFCMVVCVLFAALWARSYIHWDIFSYHDSSRWLSMSVSQGVLNIDTGLWSDATHELPRLYWQQMDPVQPKLGPGERLAKMPWFECEVYATGVSHLLIAIWLPVLTAIVLATLIRPQPRLRFGLRELFVLSTIGAITVGILAVVLRSISS